jgi:hypothetical protein
LTACVVGKGFLLRGELQGALATALPKATLGAILIEQETTKTDNGLFSE